MLIINVVSVDKDGTPMSAALIVNLMLKVTCVNSGSDLTRINCGWAAEKGCLICATLELFCSAQGITHYIHLSGGYGVLLSVTQVR